MFCLKTFILNSFSVNTKLLRNYRPARSDPGIRRRKEIMETKIFEELDETDFEDQEADFMDIQKSHKEHLSELAREKEKLRYQIVRRKYFKEHYPNFLTWNEKEQIKYLHSTNPEEWTIERLSESFPALPEIIQRVVRAKYSKKDAQVTSHDAAVKRNWELLKKNEMPNLPPQLIAHLNKFTNRGSNFTYIKIPEAKEIVNKRKVPPVFSEIITSYESLKNECQEKEKCDQVEMNLNKTNLGITENIIDKRKFASSVTLESLQNKLEKKHQSGKELKEDEKLMLKNLKVDEKPKIVELTNYKDVSVKKFQKSDSKLIQKRQDYSHLIYPERIQIPRDKFKEGYTYKLNDCYYHSDGSFLYRVPGME